MKLPWPQFYTLLWCWLNHLPISQSIKITELSELTIRRWFEDFRANIPDPDWLLSLKNAIQMDEAFFKGKAVIAAKAIESKKVIFPKRISRSRTSLNLFAAILSQGQSCLRTEPHTTRVFRGLGRSSTKEISIPNGNFQRPPRLKDYLVI
jgi:hypothetical protein